jgi:probable rRNA maturation factor
MPISVASPPELRGLARPLAALVRVALELERRRAGEIAIVLTGDAELRALNRRWRGMNRATDVLSFPYDDRRGVVSGDLVVSMDRVRAQARRFRVTEGRELARLVVHGALHLAGLDHHAAGERRHMRAREDAALAGAGVVGGALEL